jgi:predicted nucleotidyltransferase
MSLFGRSRVRERVLLEFFAKPGTSAHVREMARRVKASAPTVGAELAELARLGVLKTETVGRSLVYSIDERSPLPEEIRALVQKTIGIEGLIATAFEGLAGVDAAYIFGSYAAGTGRAGSDVDLLVVGRPNRVALSEKLAPVERTIGRDVNVVTKTEAQVRERRSGGDPFWRQVLGKPMIHVAGREIAYRMDSTTKRNG